MNTKQLLMAGVTALTISLSLCPAQAYARTGDDAFSNLYVGGYGGYGWTNADVNGGPHLNVEGADYGAFAGFQVNNLMNNSSRAGISGALEAFYGWSSADETQNLTRIEKDHEWGINFRPGLSFFSGKWPLNLNPYAILGYRRVNLETTQNGVETDDNYNGFDLGIGSELIAYQDVGVRLDYTHVFMQKRGGIDPDENDVRMGLAYHF